MPKQTPGQVLLWQRRKDGFYRCGVLDDPGSTYPGGKTALYCVLRERKGLPPTWPDRWALYRFDDFVGEFETKQEAQSYADTEVINLFLGVRTREEH